MRLGPRKFVDAHEHLWLDMPDAQAFLRSLDTVSEPALLARFASEDFSTIDTAATPPDIADFLADVGLRLEDPAAGIQMTYWDKGAKHHV
jgi:hypothetical protein